MGVGDGQAYIAKRLKDEGNDLFQSGDYEGAVAKFSKAIKADPGNHVLYSNRSAAYLALKRHEEALSDAEKCVELNMDWPKGYARQGAALQALGRYAEAEACFQIGLVMSPGNAILERGLAALHRLTGTGEDGDAADGGGGAGGATGAASGAAAAPAGSGAETEGAVVDRKARAAELKGEGNERFKAKDYAGAIACFGKAIGFDPNNHVLYSNRSAAHLAMERPDQALEDADMCIELNSSWGKGYGRKASALMALKRFADAIAVYRTGLAADPRNRTLRGGMAAAEATRRAEHARVEAEAKAEEERERKREEEGAENEALLASFMGEIKEVEKEAQQQERDLDRDPKAHIDRLLQRHYKWKNLNPYHVLQLPPSASEDDVKRRYKKLSAIIHPDKLSDPQASDAFQEVKRAYEALIDEEERKRVHGILQQSRQRVLRERKRLKKKGVEERNLPPLKEQLQTETMKTFATAEHRRQKAIQLKQEYRKRERTAEDEVKQAEKEKKEVEKAWARGREDRFSEWRSFVHEERAAKVMRRGPAVSAETRTGVKRFKDGEEYKKGWK